MEIPKIPILMYHSIKDVGRSEPMRSIHVPPTRFANQIRLIKTLGYRGCSVTEAVDSLSRGCQDKLVALTFDDGYLNFYTAALPILKKFGFTATVYVVSELIGKINEWDLPSGISENPLMSERELKTCVQDGVEIGCHTASHKSLVEQSTNFERELTEAKSHIEALLDQSCMSFCYPYGHYDDRTVEQVRQAGFNNATTMIRGRATSKDDVFELPRIPINWHTMPHLFLIKLLTSYEDKRRGR